MTHKEKQLLLKDLCARLPYGVEIHIDFTENGHIVGDAVLDTIKAVTGQLFGFTDFKQDFKNGDSCPISGFGGNRNLHLEDFKPYLRPMSSMTEEENEEWIKASNMKFDMEDGFVDVYDAHFSTDWLNSHHFDFRNLIEKGLAIDCTNLDIY